CKLNDINPLEWLTQTLRKIPEYKINQLHELLPIRK
ncbi:transposase domain-containing protein, partial [Fulvivirga sp. M361]